MDLQSLTELDAELAPDCGDELPSEGGHGGWVTTTLAALEEMARIEPLPFLRPGDSTPCSTHPDPDLWFDRRRKKQAAAICGTCKVAPQCAAYAERNGLQGTWGGLDGGLAPVSIESH